MPEQPDSEIMELAEFCLDMLQLCKNWMDKSAIGMYWHFIHGSTDAADCTYVKKSRKLYYDKQRQNIFPLLERKLVQLQVIVDRMRSSEATRATGNPGEYEGRGNGSRTRDPSSQGR